MRVDRALLLQEFDRKLFHVAWALLPLLYYLGYPKAGMLLLLFIELLIWAGIEVLRLKGLDLIPSGLMREHEKRGAPMGTLYQLIAMLLAVLFFEKEVAVLAMLFCCVGDSVTAFAGALLAPYAGIGKISIRTRDSEERWRFFPFEDIRHALGHRKSAVLMVVMFTVCLAIAFLFLPGQPVPVIVAGCAGAVIADAFAWRVAGFILDDDLTVPIISGAAMTMAAMI